MKEGKDSKLKFEVSDRGLLPFAGLSGVIKLASVSGGQDCGLVLNSRAIGHTVLPFNSTNVFSFLVHICIRSDSSDNDTEEELDEAHREVEQGIDFH